MIKVENHKEHYTDCFDNYPVFHLFIEYAFHHVDYVIYVDDLDNPQTVIMHVPPAYIFYGKTKENEMKSIQSIVQIGSWIISPNQSWDVFIHTIFQDQIQVFPRLLFEGSQLSLSHLKELCAPLPPELKIVSIQKEHLQKGMIRDQIINKFFLDTDFLHHGFGLALVNDKGVVHGFALTNYPIEYYSHEIEVSYRVGYDDYPFYRHKGIGTTLVCQFIIEALRRGFYPIWDAANDISSHIARKLGYLDCYQWSMYHIVNKD